MKKKDNEIVELKSALRSVEKNFADEIKERDIVITDLFAKLGELKSNDQPTAVEAIDHNDSAANLDESSAEVTTPVEKVEHDLLVLGDSLLRNLNPEAINPGGDTTIECVPGARPEGLIDKFNEMSKTTSYKRIIVHAGTNLVPKFSRATAADKIIEALEKIRKLSPHSKVAFSALLPKDGINEINYRVERGGQCGHYRTRYGFVRHGKFFVNRGHVDRRLFQRDGIHLTDIGSRALEKSINCFAVL